MSDQSEWAQRIDRLLAGNVAQQVGTALEAVFERLGGLAERVESLESLRAPVERLVAALTERYEDGGAKQIADIGESVSAVSAAVHGLGRAVVERADGAGYRVEARLSKISDRLETLDRRLQGPAPVDSGADRDVIGEQIETANRKLGSAIGRLRVQIDGIEERLRSIEGRLLSQQEMAAGGPGRE